MNWVKDNRIRWLRTIGLIGTDSGCMSEVEMQHCINKIGEIYYWYSKFIVRNRIIVRSVTQFKNKDIWTFIK